MQQETIAILERVKSVTPLFHCVCTVYTEDKMIFDIGFYMLKRFEVIWVHGVATCVVDIDDILFSVFISSIVCRCYYFTAYCVFIICRLFSGLVV